MLFVRVVVASVVMAGLLIWGMGSLTDWMQWGLWQRVGQLVLWVVLGAGVYFMVLLIMGVKLKQLMMLKSE